MEVILPLRRRHVLGQRQTNARTPLAVHQEVPVQPADQLLLECWVRFERMGISTDQFGDEGQGQDDSRNPLVCD